ncbi:MAG: ABC transporter permease [Planctomycetota bacterium]
MSDFSEADRSPSGDQVPEDGGRSSSSSRLYGDAHQPRHRVSSGTPFLILLALFGGTYIVLVVGLIVADFAYLFVEGTAFGEFSRVLQDENVHFSILLSLLSCTVTTVLALWVSVPIGYLMTRYRFRGQALVETALDIPIVLPPLVVGISLIILFKWLPKSLNDWVMFKIPAVILAQFVVASAFAVRTLRVTFERIPRRFEDVALTLGCSQSQAFWRVVLPQAREGMVAAATLAWARSLGEFGPIITFVGSTPKRTEVLPTTVFLEQQAGNNSGALAVSIIMIVIAAFVLLVARRLGMRRLMA